MENDISWDTPHSSAVAGVMFGGLVYTLMRLHQSVPSDMWEADLFEQISRHFDQTLEIPIRGDGDRAALTEQGSSEAMREAHRVLAEAFSLARRISQPK